MGTRLYIGNLPYGATEADLKTVFEEAGTVTNCNVILDKMTGNSRGFAFVEMSTQEEADRAVAELNGRDLQGRALRVNEARPREERGGGDFGGGGGGGGGGDRRRDFDRRRR